MANSQVQWAGVPDGPSGDLAVRNYTNAALIAGALVVLDTSFPLGSTDPLASGGTIQFGVWLPPTGVAAVGSFGSVIANIAAKDAGSVRTRGIVVGVGRGAITMGDLLSICTVAAHEGQAQKAASGEEIIGQALQTVADGDAVLFRILTPPSPAP